MFFCAALWQSFGLFPVALWLLPSCQRVPELLTPDALRPTPYCLKRTREVSKRAVAAATVQRSHGSNVYPSLHLHDSILYFTRQRKHSSTTRAA